MNINEIANRIFLNFNEEESKKVENEIEILNKEIAVLNDINTDDVLAMDMPFELNENTFKIILTQGLNRQIRKMCKTLGYEVIKLKRIRILNISLDDIDYGKWRYIIYIF